MPCRFSRAVLVATSLVMAWPVSATPATPVPVAVLDEARGVCGDASRRDVATGLDALALLDPAAALAAFTRAEAADPRCPLGPWGLSLAWIRLPDADAADAEWSQAGMALQRALLAADRLATRDAFVRELLAAARPLLEPDPPLARLRAFATSSWTLAQRHPGDRRAVLPAALAALATSSLPGDEWHRRAASLVAPAPGGAEDAASLSVHVLACEGSGDHARDPASGAAATCLEAARALVGLAPAAPRTLVAAARVLFGGGEWALAVDAAAAAGRAVRGPAPWLEPGRCSDHPLAWLVAAESERGRFSSARAALQDQTRRYATEAGGLAPVEAWRWRSALDLASMRLQWAAVDWQGARDWPLAMQATLDAAGVAPPAGEAAVPDDLRLWREVRATKALLGGLLAARAAWPRAEPDRLEAARQAARVLEQLAAEEPAPPRIEWMRTLVLAATAAALEARDELALLLAHADALQRSLSEAGVTGLPVSGDTLAGEWHLQLHDAADAARRFTSATDRGPGVARAWFGLGRAERAAGRTDAAARACAHAHAIWAAADEPRPEITEAQACAVAEKRSQAQPHR